MLKQSGLLPSLFLLVICTIAACEDGKPTEISPLADESALTPITTSTVVPSARATTIVALPPSPPTALPTASIPAQTPTVVPAPPTVPTSPTVPVVVKLPPETPTVIPTPSPTGVPSQVPTPTPTRTAIPAPRELTPSPIPTATPQPTVIPDPIVVEEPTPVPESTVVTNGTVSPGELILQTETVFTTVEVVKMLRPSVVHVATRTLLGTGGAALPDILEGVGTGIVIDHEGHILTNNHVVEDAQAIVVTLNTGDSFPARLVGRDRVTDTAIIQIDTEDLEPARLGDSATTEVGEDVIAIGHALGLAGGPTVSKGVVSALDRSIETDPRTTMVDLIQTDASINPGNSGGPLVNMMAEIIGINTAIITEGQGIGFAINIDDAKAIVTQLIDKGFVERGFIGVTPFNVTPERISQFNLQLPEDVRQGIFVAAVIPDTPAERVGIRPGDVIVQMGTQPIANTGELAKFLLDHLPGQTVQIVYYRGPEKRLADLTLGEYPRG